MTPTEGDKLMEQSETVIRNGDEKSTTSTRERNIRNPASVALVAGLVLAAIGLLIQVFTGVPGFPTIPPGPIILLAAAAFVVFAPWRWAPVVGLIAALFLSVGAAVTPNSGIGDRLGNLGEFGPFAGTALFLLGLLLALVAGVVATARGLRRRRARRPGRDSSLGA